MFHLVAGRFLKIVSAYLFPDVQEHRWIEKWILPVPSAESVAPTYSIKMSKIKEKEQKLLLFF